MWLFLRCLLVFCLFLLLKDGIFITSGGIEILYISGSLFRFVFLFDCLYYLDEYLFPWLYRIFKLSFKKIIFILDNQIKKC